ncbi:hypothetical protein [Robertmurraya siralis]|nr:hypothetical protein [Robertmurraya siralis]
MRERTGAIQVRGKGGAGEVAFNQQKKYVQKELNRFILIVVGLNNE